MVGAREDRAAGDIGFGGCHVAAERGSAGERPGARIAGLEHAALDFDACRYPRRVRTNLDHDLTVVSQPEAYNSRQVTGSEQLLRRRAAQMLHAPAGKAARIDGTRAR
ncbi:hypothetical protein GCM10027569_66240 [Flindersiella endophytica]